MDGRASPRPDSGVRPVPGMTRAACCIAPVPMASPLLMAGPVLMAGPLPMTESGCGAMQPADRRVAGVRR